jgi:FdhD protein
VIINLVHSGHKNVRKILFYVLERGMKMVEKVKMVRMENGAYIKMEDLVVEEENVEIFLDGNSVETFPCTPKDLKYLAIGHLVCNGIVPFDTSKKYEIQISSFRINVSSGASENQVEMDKHPTFTSHEFNWQRMPEYMKELLNLSSNFLKTGGCHVAGLFDLEKKRYAYICEDVSRHSAVEKCVGYLFYHGDEIQNPAIFLSGRVNFKIVQECANVGISVIVTKGAITSKAIFEAQKRGMVLIGFAREERANVYSGFEKMRF